MKIIITGVPGCGKTTISQKLSKKGLQVVNFGDCMFQIAKKRFELTDRDDMRRVLSPDEYRTVQREAGKSIGKMEGHVIIDTHASIKTQYGFYPGLPTEVLQSIDPTVIALIEHRPSTIIYRRQKDAKSGLRVGRDKEAERAILRHQQINEFFSTVYASLVSCFIFIIDLRWAESYPFEHADKATERILDLIETAKADTHS